MQDTRVSETFSLAITHWDNGMTSLYVRGVLGEGLDDFEGERMYRRVDVGHQLCDDAQRLVCGWAEFGALGLHNALHTIRLSDAY